MNYNTVGWLLGLAGFVLWVVMWYAVGKVCVWLDSKD